MGPALSEAARHESAAVGLRLPKETAQALAKAACDIEITVVAAPQGVKSGVQRSLLKC